jgi:hypothetical protein
MRFVDDDLAHTGIAQGAQESIVAEAFRRNVDQLELTPGELVEAGAHLFTGKGAVD